MADLLQKAASWLNDRLKESASTIVEYRRGSSTISELKATVGQSLLRLSDEVGGVQIERTDADFLIAAADLDAGGIASPPQRGDVIARTVGNTTYLYEVRTFGSEPEWRWSDPHHVLVRVHTKLIGTE
ncbi:MAG: hypothetical protein KatS3mg105_3299 [Gemmatales bacterium]|nr:MAG: hypothetical protein KatS3mg105_3299 [Gemmatales bacterium]